MDEQQFQQDVMRSLGKLEASIMALQSQLSAHDQRVIHLTARIVSLEKWQAKVVGIVVAVASVAGLIANWLGKKLGL